MKPFKSLNRRNWKQKLPISRDCCTFLWWCLESSLGTVPLPALSYCCLLKCPWHKPLLSSEILLVFHTQGLRGFSAWELGERPLPKSLPFGLVEGSSPPPPKQSSIITAGFSTKKNPEERTSSGMAFPLWKHWVSLGM